MKTLFIIFFGILFFKEFLIINYEIIIIIGFIMVLYFLIQNLVPLFTNFFINVKQNTAQEITNKLYQKMNKVTLKIENLKGIILFSRK